MNFNPTFADPVLMKYISNNKFINVVLHCNLVSSKVIR